ncbi:hypothetical protein H9X84_05875 [Anaerotignum lactatifermentans]|nr:hypothetical protein [Anaerotignum lactatifermentans]
MRKEWVGAAEAAFTFPADLPEGETQKQFAHKKTAADAVLPYVRAPESARSHRTKTVLTKKFKPYYSQKTPSCQMKRNGY